MTPKQAATLVSRAFCLWFAYGAFTRLSVIPSVFYSMRMLTMMNTQAVVNGSVVSGRYHAYTPSPFLMMGSNILGMSGLLTLVADIALAIIFYRCGPRVIRFFLGKQTEPDAPETT